MCALIFDHLVGVSRWGGQASTGVDQRAESENIEVCRRQIEDQAGTKRSWWTEQKVSGRGGGSAVQLCPAPL